MEGSWKERASEVGEIEERGGGHVSVQKEGRWSRLALLTVRLHSCVKSAMSCCNVLSTTVIFIYCKSAMRYFGVHSKVCNVVSTVKSIYYKSAIKNLQCYVYPTVKCTNPEKNLQWCITPEWSVLCGSVPTGRLRASG